MCTHKSHSSRHYKQTFVSVLGSNNYVQDAMGLHPFSIEAADSTPSLQWEYGHLISRTPFPQHLQSIMPFGVAAINGH